MNRFTGIDYTFKPQSYWEDSSVLQALLRDVKGVQRRKMIVDYYEQDALNQLDDTFLQSTLSEEQRQRFGLIHPSFMGGEYLPDCTEDETEIARIELESTLADVTSIRAKRVDDEYHYNVVDEHGDTYSLYTDTSFETFTLGELIDFIDYTEQVGGWCGGLSLSYNNANAESLDRERLRNFTTITSEIYPQLEEHYDRVFADWVAEEKEEEVNL